MALTPGTRLGPYAVTAQIGLGGMGEVYRATDTKLKREIAIKVLPDAFARDPDRLARFEREARTLASLNHPNIAAIYGLEDADGVKALVMELVEGPTLADRIAQGAIPVDAALPIARQVADALDAAHEQGIVHRDLKPANIKVREDGTVKVLDFGLAKALGPAGASSDVSQLATVTAPAVMTGVGVILGTPACMSPEQVRGKAVDKRADIWAFGCLLYEMLSGRGPFVGATISDTLAAILDREPDWSRLPTATPAGITRLLRRCLQKEAGQRLRDIGDARADIEMSSEGSTGEPRDGRKTRTFGWRSHAATIFVTGGVVALAGSWLASGTGVRDSEQLVVRTSVMLPPDMNLARGAGELSLAVSPDGTRIAFVAQRTGEDARLYVRSLSEISPVAVPGASGATNPFFSSDGQSLGFFANDRLQRAPISGGSPVQLCDVSGLVMGASWSSDGTIVFAVRGAGLFRVSAEGGAPERLLESTDAAWPTILPDGNTVLFTVGGGLLVAVPIRGGVPSVVARRSDALGAAATSPQWEAEAKDAPRLGAGWLLQAQYLPSGHLLYGQGAGVVRAVAFDAASSVVRGSPETVFDPVFVAPGAGAVHFAASETGLVVYGPEDRRRELVWVDRTGRETSLGFDADPLRFVSLSPDGTQVALSLDSDVRNSDIWIYDVNQRTRRRFTSDQHNLRAVWTPDGTRLWFYRTGALASKALNGASAQDIALRTADNTPTSWSRDGRSLLFDVNSPAAARDIWRLSLEGPSVPRPLLASPFDEHYAKFSPNDRWAAFVSNESGREEVYVASVERLGDKIAVSSAGGTAPAWAHNGRELFFRQGRAVMSVAIDPARGLPLGRPTLLFDGDGYQGASGDVQFDVDPTDSRFLMLRVVDASAARQLVVVQNWVEELRRLVPTN